MDIRSECLGNTWGRKKKRKIIANPKTRPGIPKSTESNRRASDGVTGRGGRRSRLLYPKFRPRTNLTRGNAGRTNNINTKSRITDVITAVIVCSQFIRIKPPPIE